MKYLFLLFQILPTFLYCQNFNVNVYRIEGDLNKDGLDDIAVLKQDTVNTHYPYLLEIYLQKKGGSLELAVSSKQAVPEKYYTGKDMPSTNTITPEIYIRKGILYLENYLTRGMFIHKFRYQHGSFELIGYTHSESDQFDMSSIDFNLMTGNRIYKNTSRDDYKETVKNSKILIRPLPKLQDFKPLSNKYY